MADLQSGNSGQWPPDSITGRQAVAPADDIPRAPPAPGSRPPEWLRPRVEPEGLQRYLETIRERAGLIALCVLLTTLAGVAYVSVAPNVYRAEADLLITPVSSESPVYVGLGLIHTTNDPTRDVLTASKLVTIPSVARLVIAELGLTTPPLKLLRKVEALPVTQSNIVAVRAKAASPAEAQRLADSFAQQTVADRTSALRRQLDQMLPELEKQVSAASPDQGSGPALLVDRYLSLQTLRAGTDPTIQVLAKAELPERPISPRPKLTIAAGVLAGLILGLSAAFSRRMLDNRLRREDQLRSMLRVPLLCRVPYEKRRQRPRPIAPARLSAAGKEAFRTLRSSLAALETAGSTARVVFVAGSTPSEGKTTTAINLAAAFAESGASVILIDADMRRPAVGTTLGTAGLHGIEEVLLGTVTLADALVSAGPELPGLRLLLAGGSFTELGSRLSVPMARRVISEARSMADYVVVDSPPLTEVIDALPLAHQADEIVVVARLKKTNLDKLADLGELLARNSLRPAGTVLVGVDAAAWSSYYYRSGHRSGPDDGTGPRRRRMKAVRP
ncbi:MAG: tyrosine-protein kinase [Actinomycetota bacterium]|jgi:receptor protein-tyrosine kinase|nr:tyrosine-protein kinase [Actinomycetota bacterium]